jgi:hypothetical protein
VSRPVPRHDGGGIVMSASTEQYDKRREPCFKGLPVSRFGHVSSNVADSVHNSVVMSALSRHLVACGDLDNFVLEIARIVMDFRKSDYSARKVWRAVKRFVVCRAAWRFGETNAIYVFARIYHDFCLQSGLPPPFRGEPLRPHFHRFWPVMRRQYNAALPC